MNARAAGGDGIAVSIGPYGAVSVGFTMMQPIRFSVSIGSTVASGVFTYAGSATGIMTVEPTSTPPSPAGSGNWGPATAADWTYTRLTVELTEPDRRRPIDNAALDHYTGASATATGQVVDIDPFFDSARFTCLGDGILHLTPSTSGELPLRLVRL